MVRLELEIVLIDPGWSTVSKSVIHVFTRFTVSIEIKRFIYFARIKTAKSYPNASHDMSYKDNTNNQREESNKIILSLLRLFVKDTSHSKLKRN